MTLKSCDELDDLWINELLKYLKQVIIICVQYVFFCVISFKSFRIDFVICVMHLYFNLRDAVISQWSSRQ